MIRKADEIWSLDLKEKKWISWNVKKIMWTCVDTVLLILEKASPGKTPDYTRKVVSKWGSLYIKKSFESIGK